MTDSTNPTARAFFSDGQPRASSRVVELDGKPATGLARGSSEWWIERLLAKMAMRNGRLGMLRDYYRGENETWSLADRAHRDTFGDRFQNLRANLAAPVVEVVEQRMTVGDILIPGDDEGSDRAWSMWTQNSLEARSSEAHLDLLSTGISHVLVDPWRTVAPGIPLITIEDPLAVIVEHDVADPRTRLAALKRWEDDEAGRSIVVLYLPDRIEWWSTKDKPQDGKPRTWQMSDGQGGPNPMGVVPMVELRNAPRARAEHEGIIDQCKQVAAALYRLATAAHYTSYRQKWASGIDDEEEEVEVDAAGNPLHSPPAAAQSGPDTVTTTSNEAARFGTFEQSDMVPFIHEIEMYQSLAATISSTPHRLMLRPPTSVPSSGESVRLEDLPLTQKIGRKFVTVGNGWETVTRLAFLAGGDIVRATRMDMETWWRDPEPHTISEQMDALVKAKSLGIPLDEVWRRYGAMPRDIRRWKREGVVDQPPTEPTAMA